ncbi:MAG: hypothetical protein OXN97_10455 [Bryobacterales bacterium]|nr:hypothetical protein [Bryobacterales bacterium]
MRTVAIAAAMMLAAGVSVVADSDGGHTYKKAAAVNDLMEYMVKPAMDKIKAYGEAGGPSDKAEWQSAFGAVSMVNEATQLVLMDGRVKDEAWRDGAMKVVAATRDAMMGAYRMDADGYNKGLKAMRGGCKTCHDVHKKDE